jgi:hypothetical protein
MTLIIQKPTGAKLNLRKGWQPMDPDAAAYITAVETADTEPLEEKTKIAIDNFVLGCKADGIWTAIKASCILAGARTLTGALVPLVGDAPTNVGPFVTGDYNRKTGLAGNGSTKYLNSNRAASADPLNSHHVSVFVSNASAVTAQTFIGAGGPSDTTLIQTTSTAMFFRMRTGTGATLGSNTTTGFIAASRSSSAEFMSRLSGQGFTTAAASNAASPNFIAVFARNDNVGINQYGAHRLAFYSIGESLNLALLDARVTDLITAIGAAF